MRKFIDLFSKKPPNRHNRVITPIITIKTPVPLREVTSFDPGKFPKDYIDRFISQVNELIQGYNATPDDATKLAVIKIILDQLQFNNNQFPDSYFEQSPAYRKAYELLMTDIQYQLREQLPKSASPNIQKQPTSVAELIAKLSPISVGQLTQILNEVDYNPTERINTLRLELEELKHPDAEILYILLKEYEINQIGGNNSKNFTFKNKTNQITKVIKVDNPFDTPRSRGAYIRERMPNNFSPIEAMQRATYDMRQEGTSRVLLVTEYYPKKSLDEYRNKLDSADVETVTVTIFTKMANLFLEIQNNKCMFTDAKWQNMLLDNTDNLIISDTKSIVNVDEFGVYSQSIPGNEYDPNEFVQTSGFAPPEFDQRSCIRADKVHAYILGRNLYNFILNATSYDRNATDLDFSYQEFRTPKGIQLQKLIMGLVKTDVSARMSVSEALNALFVINNPFWASVYERLHYRKNFCNDPKLFAIMDTIKSKNELTDDERQKLKDDIEAEISIFEKQDERFFEAVNGLYKVDPYKNNIIRDDYLDVALSEREDYIQKLETELNEKNLEQQKALEKQSAFKDALVNVEPETDPSNKGKLSF